MFQKVLIANRGAIATRIIRTLNAMDIVSVAVYHEADKTSLHVLNADEKVSLGDGYVAETYLNIEKIIQIAQEHQVDAIHPGYGFLSENTEFVAACERAGIQFIGPTSAQIQQFGLKHKARELAEQAQVPLVPGSPVLDSLDDAIRWSDHIGFPVMLKSSAGGGGIGMEICRDVAELTDAWEKVRRLSENYFSNNSVFVEKFIANARHIEVQVFGDGDGEVISLGERDCSAQRRNQKVLEETPAPNLDDETRQQLWRTAERLMANVSYRNAGTVEFIFDSDTKAFYFLEVNTRLQVEHGVTEEVWGVDIVRWMVQLAAGDLPSLQELKRPLRPTGHAVQVRVYAEDPIKNFQPSAGLLTQVDWKQNGRLRIDTWVCAGQEVPALFDPMIAKVIAVAENRETALEQLANTLAQSQLYGIETNLEYLSALVASQVARQGKLLTRTLNEFSFTSFSIDVINAGTQTTIQDYPGRRGYWHVGVPPSGPMDNVSFRLANELLGNSTSAAALEVLLQGPTLTFQYSTWAAICGAELEVAIDGEAQPMNQVIKIAAGQTLKLGNIQASGARAYLAIAGGFQCPEYLGSRATFTLGQFGGHAGRALRVGDVLHGSRADSVGERTIATSCLPEISDQMTLRVTYGPHGAPEFFTEEDVKAFFDAEWQVHYNSSRTGVRLIGPKPAWARASGGEAGMHPSNIHDNAYAFGTIDFTGDMPVILGPDGPSLGGFVCPATVISADLWKLGQLKAGSKLRFQPVTLEQAIDIEAKQNHALSLLSFVEQSVDATEELISPVIYRTQLLDEELVVRLSGDHFLLLELGPMELDIARRLKIHALMLSLAANKPTGVFELTPGIRSLQIHFDSQQITVSKLLTVIDSVVDNFVNDKDITVPSRIVHLPLSWDDVACQLAIQRYDQAVRANAPWAPSNLEFIRRINGLNSIADVKDIVFSANYLVMGLGDVYLGAPVATPLDPRQRLVTTKYNPARTWTAENSVGIGGAYLCVYGMEGPGGYQFVGRTSQMWNRYRTTEDFQQPWLLRFFDQIRFYEVSHEELNELRHKIPLGEAKISVEETEFSLTDYLTELAEIDSEITNFSAHRDRAFQEELERWKQDGQFTFELQETENSPKDASQIPDGVIAIDSTVSGSVWQVNVSEGQVVEAGELLMVLESMKMEIDVRASQAGTVEKILKAAGQTAQAGQPLLWLSE